MGINEAVGAEIYNEAAGLGQNTINFLSFPVRTFVTTRCASTLVTDSSAAGTALATGTKINMGGMGIDPEGNVLTTIAERAKAVGFGAGVATSVGLNHATPAAFYSHTASRNDYDAIAEQFIASSLDFGAGAGFNLERKAGKTAEDYVEEAKAAGIEVFCGKESFKDINTSNRVLCLGDDLKLNELPYAINQTEENTNLSDFTKAAISHLYANYAKKGFFLMVEGGMIDHACHDDDAATTCEEVNDFARAIDVVLDFYNQHKNQTLIVVTADHETGGLMLGAGGYEMQPQKLIHQKVSEGVLSSKVQALSADGKTPTWEEVKAVLSENLGLWTEVEVDPATEASFLEIYNETYVKKAANDVHAWYSRNSKIASAAVDFVDKASCYGWSFGAHSGSPVGLYAIGAGSEAFAACRDNTDIPKTIAELAGY